MLTYQKSYLCTTWVPMCCQKAANWQPSSSSERSKPVSDVTLMYQINYQVLSKEKESFWIWEFSFSKEKFRSLLAVNTSFRFLIEEAGLCQQQKFSGLYYDSGHKNGINLA